MSEPRQVQRMGNLSSDFWQRQGDIGMQEHKDIYPDDEAKVSARGLWARYVNRMAIDVYRDHFRTQPEPVGVIPPGFAWAGAPFAGVPGTEEYVFNSSFMRLGSANAANEHFLWDAPIGDTKKEFVVRIRVQGIAKLQIRFDDGTDNNYAAIGLWGRLPTNTHSQVTFSLRVGGGAPVHTNVGAYPIGEYCVFRLRRQSYFADVVTNAYVIGEEGGENVLSSLSVTNWACNRVGFWFWNSNGAIADPSFCDWFYTTFLLP